MKKLLQIILAVAIVCSSLPIGVFANDGRIDSGVLSFDDVADAAGILEACNKSGLEGAMIENANIDERGTISVVDVDNEFGKSIQVANGGKGYATLYIVRNFQMNDKVEINFSVKRDSTSAPFGCYMNIGGTECYPMYFGADGYVKLCQESIMKYDANTWYDVKLEFNPMNSTQAYMKLYIKKHADSAWNRYGTFSINGYWNVAPKVMNEGVTGVGFISLDDSATTTYIDNIRCKTDKENVSLALSDDFSQMPDIVADKSVTDSTNQWAISGEPNSVKVGEINGKQALVIDAPAGYTTIGKIISQLNLPDDTTSIVKFGLGRADQNAKLICYMDALKGSATAALLTFRNDAPGLEKPDYYNLTLGDIHNFEFVYNKQKGLARLLTPANGWYYGDSDKIAGATLDQSFDFQIVANSPTTIYLSDFRYEVIDSNKCEVKDIKLESGYDKNAAAFDDKVIFEFNQPIIDTQSAACRECHLYKGDTEVTATNSDGNSIPGATVVFNQTEPNKVTVVPQVALEPGTEYKIVMPTLQGGYDESTTSASYTFTTAADEFSFAKPVIASDGTITLDAKAYVNQEKPAVLIAVAYDADGNCVEVQYTDVVAKKTNSAISFKPSFSVDHKTVSAFVWSDFSAMTPYSEHSESN